LSSLPLVEAGCGRCHASEKKLVTADGVELAPHLAHGRQVFEAQCAACHDPNASHDRALSTRFIGSAMSPSAMMAALTLPPKAMPKYFGADAAAHDARK